MISGADPNSWSDLHAWSKASPMAEVAASSNQVFGAEWIFIVISREARPEALYSYCLITEVRGRLGDEIGYPSEKGGGWSIQTTFRPFTRPMHAFRRHSRDREQNSPRPDGAVVLGLWSAIIGWLAIFVRQPRQPQTRNWIWPNAVTALSAPQSRRWIAQCISVSSWLPNRYATSMAIRFREALSRTKVDWWRVMPCLRATRFEVNAGLEIGAYPPARGPNAVWTGQSRLR